MDNDTQIDVATIVTGLTAPVWVEALEHWFGMAAAFGAMVLVFWRLYRMSKVK